MRKSRRRSIKACLRKGSSVKWKRWPGQSQSEEPKEATRAVGDLPHRPGQLMLQGRAGPDGDGDTPVGVAFEIVDVPVHGRLIPEVPLQPFRQGAPGRSHVEIVAGGKGQLAQAPHRDRHRPREVEQKEVTAGVLCLPGKEVPGDGGLPDLRGEA